VSAPFPIAASIAQRPGYGGHAWAFLQYALGLRQLGYEPVVIDRLSAEMIPGGTNGAGGGMRDEAIAWFVEAMDYVGLRDSCSLLLDGGETVGLSREELRRRIAAAPALLNVMGFLEDEELLAAAQSLVFVDVDPGFTQIWSELGQADLLRGHHRFVSVGANIGREDCMIPTCGRRWIAIRPPVALDRWPAAARSSMTFRSVGSWRGPYDPIEYEGRRLGLRAHELRRFAELPSRVGAEFELALEIDPADRDDSELLRRCGWRLADPRSAAGSLAAYRDYVASAGAEIAVAKNVYVETRSGWFSDRSACFLASGRPVLAQDTGLRGLLPASGEGLLLFETLEEAAEGAERIVAEWPRHSAAARELAEDVFDARKVMGGLLEELSAA
jgi:hypothetical protein